MSQALSKHDAILRNSVETNGGTVFKMVGDACCAVFSTAPEALHAASAAQVALSVESWGDGGELRVRMALHTGAAEERGGDYFGPPLNRVARLLSASHGGQVLLSLATHELVRDRLADGMSLMDLGEHRLKDLTRPEHIYQAVINGVRQEFPSLRTLDARPTNLPIQPTAFIGREKEIGEVCALLRQEDVRLLTLTGPAGTGKTRLGLQAGAELLDDFQDGVFFVSLAPIRDPDQVVPSIASTLDLREAGGRPLAGVLKSYLKHKQMLLVIDNFEHVADAAQELGELGQASPGLKMLVTSRVPVQLYGEQRYPVPAMSVPDQRHVPPLDRLSQYESVALFIQRASEVRPDFAVTNETAPALAEICYRLDGLPLAIELAAARVGMLPLSAILDRLSNRLKLLTSGGKDVPERQRTLRGAIEWSYDLLEERDKRLFRRLSAFAGGWTVEAAEAVCGADGDLDVFDGLASLVEKSLVRPVTGSYPRFDMLETIREYARNILEPGEYDKLPRRHAKYFLKLAVDAEPELSHEDQVLWLDRLERDRDNLRVAMEYFLHSGDGDSAMRLAPALKVFSYRRGGIREGYSYLARAVKLDGAAESVRARALTSLGQLALTLDFKTPLAELWNEVLELVPGLTTMKFVRWPYRALE
jgi:predicted ATPase